ncbi:hypothetical protein H2200_009443 [Cladophialophora chaetospira]|uniref:Indoleamine 2,3-dioxygenase n=1 Tax=Cladophialophora chaetospira TaxID=386627 RepID=A0AA38X442_9EURO|nr:hypothetical protein H2200_009443 [Cladophialophora chaetospira]
MLTRPPLPNPEEYDIDIETGFVPPNPTELPAYYAPWCNLVSDLPSLLQSKTLRAKVDDLASLQIDQLNLQEHWQRAYVILGFLTQAYVWQEKENPSAIVPASIGEPFLKVCEHFGTAPVLSYAGGSLWNWTSVAPGGHANPLETLGNFQALKSVASFTGTRDEDAFNLVPTMIEARGARLVQLLLNAIRDSQNGEQQDLVSVLDICARTFSEMAGLLPNLHDNCDPMFFFSEIRRMLAGSAGAELKGLPDGVTFQRSNGHHEVVRCVGASAGQSAFFPFLDHLLGVRHESKFLLEMRAYMPKKHREFLEAVELLPSLRDLVHDQPQDAALQTAFQLAIDAFKHWRTKHVVVVSRYVSQPSKAQANGKPMVEAKGTAGSLPIPFLKQYRDETTFTPTP